MKFVVIPDSFKGTMSSAKICELMSETMKKHFPESEVVCIPVADGGEGSVDAFLEAVGGKKEFVVVKNPYFEDMTAFYGMLENEKIAVIEMSACAGLPLVTECRKRSGSDSFAGKERKNPAKATTYGVGQMILDAAEKGAEKIIVGLGGSCTNDGGCGAASAIGVKFYNDKNEDFVPVGGTLRAIQKIDMTQRNPILKDVEIITMCDIDNPMFGKAGAAHVFAPQKGADAGMVQMLDEGLKHLSAKITQAVGRDISKIPGTGAAGAMGAGMIAFFDSHLQMGIETVLDTVHFDEKISDADYIFTGEGNMDSQSLRGKVISGIAKRAKMQNKKVIAIVGGAEDAEIKEAYEKGVTSIFTINRKPEDFSVSKWKSEENLRFTVDNLMRLLKVIK